MTTLISTHCSDFYTIIPQIMDEGLYSFKLACSISPPEFPTLLCRRNGYIQDWNECLMSAVIHKLRVSLNKSLKGFSGPGLTSLPFPTFNPVVYKASERNVNNGCQHKRSFWKLLILFFFVSWLPKLLHRYILYTILSGSITALSGVRKQIFSTFNSCNLLKHEAINLSLLFLFNGKSFQVIYFTQKGFTETRLDFYLNHNDCLLGFVCIKWLMPNINIQGLLWNSFLAPSSLHSLEADRQSLSPAAAASSSIISAQLVSVKDGHSSIPPPDQGLYTLCKFCEPN